MVLTRKRAKLAAINSTTILADRQDLNPKADIKHETDVTTQISNVKLGTGLKQETGPRLENKSETKPETKPKTKNETKPRLKQYFEKETKNPAVIEFKEAKPRPPPISKFGKIDPIWETHFENIRKMRSNFDAPVDTEGCDKLADEQDTPRNQRFQILLSLLFSSQTKDPINAACLARFKSAKIANVEACQKASEEKLAEMIRGVSFHKTKAKNLKKICDILIAHFGSDIPRTLEGLVGLPGIGYKMGHLIMVSAWGEMTGLAVDVHRTVNRLRWFKKTIDKPNDMMDALMAEIPKEYWRDINHLIVGFGQQRCFAKNPKCDGCLNRKICKF